MGVLDKVKGFLGFGATATNPVSAIAGAVGGVANAVAAGEKLADDKQLLNAGEAKGVVNDLAKTEERVAAAGAAHADDRLRTDVKNTRFRD